MPNEIFFHLYCSKAAKSFSPDELKDLLARSRANNAKSGLTGMMLYKDGHFMQVLEGPEQGIRRLLNKIYHDPRHTNLMKIMEGFTAERQFPFWYMGYENLDSDEVKELPGYSEFLNTPLDVGLATDPTASQRLLHLFKQGVRLPGQLERFK